MNKKQPLVSILLPTYNGANTIETAVASVLRQTYKNWELLILDDGSGKETKNVLKKLARFDPRIHVITNTTNMKLTRTLNKGLDLAKGKYIARIDDDDEWIHPQKLQMQVNFLEENKDYSLIGGWATLSGDKRGTYKTKTTYDEILKSMLIKNQFIHSTIVMKKTSLRYPKQYPSSEDYALWIKMMIRGEKVANLPTMLIRYSVSKSSISQNGKRTQVRSTLKLLVNSCRKPFRYRFYQLFLGFIHNLSRFIF